MEIKHGFATALAVALITQTTFAEIVTTVAGNGGDVGLRRLGTTENDGLLRIKTQSGAAEDSLNDRVGLLKFDLSSLVQPITKAAVQLELPRGASNGFPNNTFDANETLYLYGIPNLAADENFNEGAVTFANSPYTTGVGSPGDTPRDPSDTTVNGIDDTLVTLLATRTFGATTNALDKVTFQSPALVSFLQADSNDIATFILAVGTSNAGKTPVFVSDTGTEGTPFFPTILTNANAPTASTDFNNSGGTDLIDFGILRDHYLTGTTNADGDANLDGTVNHLDFFQWRTTFLASGGSLEGVSLSISVPEPAAGVLLFGGWLVAASGRRGRRHGRN